MWRRLCVDVDSDGSILGASVEFYSDRQSSEDQILVMDEGWVSRHDWSDVITALRDEGWTQLPLWCHWPPLPPWRTEG